MPSRRNRVGSASPKSLFPEISATSDGPWRLRESFYNFISRHSDPIVLEARRRMDSWFSEYPARQRPELRARIDGDEVAFYSVYYELLFHHFLIRQGYDVQVHPDLGFTTRPDFLPTSKSGDASFIMEVATATAASPTVERGKKLTRELMGIFRNLEHQRWSLVPQIEGAPRTTISKNKLVSAIQTYLQRLDDQFDHETEAEDLPSLEWKDDGVTLKFFPFRKQMNEDPTLISEPPNRMFTPVRPDNLIENTVKRKLPSRYGELSKSYLIAIGLASVHPDHVDVVGLEQKFALEEIYGRTVELNSGEYGLSQDRHHHTGKSRGVFSVGATVKNQRISALLIAHQAQPWNLHNGKLSLYMNPHALYPCDGFFQDANLYSLREDGTLFVSKGQKLLKLLE